MKARSWMVIGVGAAVVVIACFAIEYAAGWIFFLARSNSSWSNQVCSWTCTPIMPITR